LTQNNFTAPVLLGEPTGYYADAVSESALAGSNDLYLYAPPGLAWRVMRVVALNATADRTGSMVISVPYPYYYNAWSSHGGPFTPRSVDCDVLLVGGEGVGANWAGCELDDLLYLYAFGYLYPVPGLIYT